ncbi:MAG: hypothetical protein ACJATN_001920 [Neolewinella sp.]|jgi:hypothetical protein
MKSSTFFTLLLVLGVSLGLSAQATTSALTGRIADVDNIGLVGATIKAVHTPTGTVYGTSAQVDGYYAIPNMRIGGP